jgi:hypothetical protein
VYIVPAIEFIVKTILHYMPTIFGFAFFGPLFAQIITKLGWLPPFDISPLLIGLAIGGIWGISAQLRGSWI